MLDHHEYRRRSSGSQIRPWLNCSPCSIVFRLPTNLCPHPGRTRGIIHRINKYRNGTRAESFVSDFGWSRQAGGDCRSQGPRSTIISNNVSKHIRKAGAVTGEVRWWRVVQSINAVGRIVICVDDANSTASQRGEHGLNVGCGANAHDTIRLQ